MKEIVIDGCVYLVDLEKLTIKPKTLIPATLKGGQKYKHKWHDEVIYMGCTSTSSTHKNCMIVLQGGVKIGDIVNPPDEGSKGFWDQFYETND